MLANSRVRYETLRLLRQIRAGTVRWRPTARRLWWIFVRQHETEICSSCGGPVARHTPSWWWSDDALWMRVVGDPAAIRCVPCFTDQARSAGVTVSWQPVMEYEICRRCYRVPESCACTRAFRKAQQ